MGRVGIRVLGRVGAGQDGVGIELGALRVGTGTVSSTRSPVGEPA